MTMLFRLLLLFACWLMPLSVSAAQQSPLSDAIDANDAAQVATLLAAGADVNAGAGTRITALHSAAGAGGLDIGKLLIAKGADINARDMDGMTPLHWAAFNGRLEFAQLLLAKGADPNAADGRGLSALHYAAANDKALVVELLIARGGGVDALSSLGESPLQVAVSFDKVAATKTLLAHGAAVNAPAPNGETPLHMAAFGGDPAMVAALLENGAEFNAKTPEGRTPVQIAIANHRYAAAELLEARLVMRGLLHADGALAQLTEKLAEDPGDDDVRRLLFKLAAAMQPAPAIPAAARKAYREGEALYRSAADATQAASAAGRFREALTIAPWWLNAYYNLGLAEQLAGRAEAAEHAFDSYLVGNPPPADAREAQARIAILAASR